MNEIKYRFVFDVKHMVEQNKTLDHLQTFIIFLDELIPSHDDYSEEYEIFQAYCMNHQGQMIAKDKFTTLYDKNEKEIFEGDILRIPPKNEWEKANYIAYEVFFHDGDCAINHIGFQMNRTHYQGSICGGGSTFSFLPKVTKQMIKIGNIHQNQELLK